MWITISRVRVEEKNGIRKEKMEKMNLPAFPPCGLPAKGTVVQLLERAPSSARGVTSIKVICGLRF